MEGQICDELLCMYLLVLCWQADVFSHVGGSLYRAQRTDFQRTRGFHRQSGQIRIRPPAAVH